MTASYKHLPLELRKHLRSFGIRPQKQSCFQNCQRIVLAARGTPLEGRLEYREGWFQSVIPIKHAWLMFDGCIQDPTLGDTTPEQYLESISYTHEQIVAHLVRDQTWSAVDDRVLFELQFPGAYEAFVELQRA